MRTAIFLAAIGIFAASAPGFAARPGDNSQMSCKAAQVPATGKPGLRCHFAESWEYVYGSNILQVLRDTADFALRNVNEECGKHSLALEPNSNPQDKVYGTGGILNSKVEQEIRAWSVYAAVSGDFYCVKKEDLARQL